LCIDEDTSELIDASASYLPSEHALDDNHVGGCVTEEVFVYRLHAPGYELTVERVEEEWKGSVRTGSQKILARITRQET